MNPKILRRRIEKEVDEKKLLPEGQAGFRKKIDHG